MVESPAENQRDSGRRVRSWAFHSFLFGLFPILSLLAHNIALVDLSVALRSIAVALAGIAATGLLLLAVFRNVRRAAFVTSLVVVPFFAVGHIHGAGGSSTEAGTSGPAVIFYALWFVAVFASLVLLLRYRPRLIRLTAILNFAAAVLVLIPAARIGLYEVRYRSAGATRVGDTVGEEGVVAADARELPDIYYILLDGYTRADVMDMLFGYDNSKFITALRERGFYVADQSCSNYAHTLQSMASLLNFQYLDKLLDKVPVEKRGGDRWLEQAIRRSRVVRFVRSNGYRYVSFGTGFWPLGVWHPDVELSPGRGFTQFEHQLINTTPIAPLLTRLPVDDQHDQHRRQILYTLDTLGDTSVRGPLFVFAHIVAAHPPFVLGADCEPVLPGRPFSFKSPPPSLFIEGYRNQVNCVNRRVLAAVDRVLANSERPPVIVIAGDHGSRMLNSRRYSTNARFSDVFPILNAYYLPGAAKPPLYEGISPVNTFRVVFNHVFGTDHKLLPDTQHFSTVDAKHEFHEVKPEAIAPSQRLFKMAILEERKPHPGVSEESNKR